MRIYKIRMRIKKECSEIISFSLIFAHKCVFEHVFKANTTDYE